MANDYFDLKRFGRLWAAHWADHRRDYVWFLVVALILDLVCMLLVFSGQQGVQRRYTGFQYDAQMSWYLTGLYLTGAVFTARYFRQLTEPGAALIWLMRPASVLEKCMLALVMISLVFPLVYSLVFMLVHAPVVSLAEQLYFCKDCSYSPDFRLYFPLREFEGNWDSYKLEVMALLMLWLMQSYIVSAYAFFKRSPLLWLVIASFLLGVLLILADVEPQLDYFSSYLSRGEIPDAEFYLALFFWASLPCLLWLSSYFHLKQREVA